VHVIGAPAWSNTQFIDDVDQSADLRLPADVTASGFYITNAKVSPNPTPAATPEPYPEP
jgi:hypothetical protein